MVLEPQRAELYARCDARLQAMAAAGALEEVARLAARDLPSELPAMKALGVPELAGFLRGDLMLTEAIATAQRKTRNYAKRQSTWFRNQTPDWPRITALDPQAAVGGDAGLGRPLASLTARARRPLRAPMRRLKTVYLAGPRRPLSGR